MRGALLVLVGDDWAYRLWDVNATSFSSMSHQIRGLVDVVPDLTPYHTVIHVNGRTRVRQQAKKLLRHGLKCMAGSALPEVQVPPSLGL
jgi:hypothetical protein